MDTRFHSNRSSKWVIGALSALILITSVDPICAATFSGSIQLRSGSPNTVVVSWPATPGLSYDVLVTSALPGNSWTPANSIPLVATNSLMSFSQTPVDGVRYFRIQQLPSQPAIATTLLGVCRQDWKASDAWVPGNLTATITVSTTTLISLGVWWDGSGNSNLPDDNLGTFAEAVNTPHPAGESPVQVQIAYEPAAAVGGHVITPDIIGGSGDGFFVVLQAEGLSASATLLDVGHARDWHPYYGFGDPNSIESITVSTDGAMAKAGDLAVAVFVMDPNSNPDIKTQLPPGWTLISKNDNATDNVGYLACYRIVDSPGAQSVTFKWTDDSTFVAEAGIAIFASAGTSQ